jgi:acyl-CoA thioester hydrolase
MYVAETKVRVRYGETDQMGYVYYGNYPLYYEVARTDMIRKLGWPYKKLEESGIMLPVLSLNVKYIKPAFYDDVLTVKTKVIKLPETRIDFEYEVFNEQNELINIGETTLVFVDMKTMKPTAAPEAFINDIRKYFE